MPSGIIIKGIGGFYYVLSEDVLFECKARGVFRKNDTVPLPGDRVGFAVIDSEKRTGSIDEIYIRETQLARPAVANVNQVAVVIAVKSPAPDFLLLDKLLITANKENLRVIICINKIDLDTDGENEKITGIYSKAGYRTILTSSKTNEGLDELDETLKGKITVFAGQSGVGKSTILNSIMNTYIMQTGGLSGKIERGRHTTRHAELVPLIGGGFIVDTPGFSSFELTDMEPNELQMFYPEFGIVEGCCRFSGCSHINEPDCKVKHALTAGTVSPARYERYVGLYCSLKQSYDSRYKKTDKERK